MKTKRNKTPQVKRVVRWADPPAEQPRNQTREIGHKRSGPPTGRSRGSDRSLWIIGFWLLMGAFAAFLIATAAGCQSQPAQEYPWIGNPLPKPPTFRHIGPGQWLVSDGKGTTRMTAKE